MRLFLSVDLADSESFGALARLLYYLGILCTETRVILREWENAFPKARRKHKGMIAADEIKIRIEDNRMYPWAVMERDTREILAVYLSTTRSGFDALRFLKNMIGHCNDRPLLVISTLVF